MKFEFIHAKIYLLIKEKWSMDKFRNQDMQIDD